MEKSLMISASELKFCLLLIVLPPLFVGPTSAWASREAFYWNGHLRGVGSIDYFSADHLLSASAGQREFINGSLDGRLNLMAYPAERLRFELAYEAVLSGDRRGRSFTTTPVITLIYPQTPSLSRLNHPMMTSFFH
jgi:hypothetical protein